MESIKPRLMTIERVTLLAVLAKAIHELTIRAQSFYDQPSAIDGMRETNEAVHSVSGHLRDLIDANEPLTSSRAEAIVEAISLLTPAALNRLCELTA